MITIEINNVKSKIIGLSEKQNTMLYDKLSYEDEADIYLKLKNPKLFGIDTRKRLYQPKRNIFPTGLLHRVVELFPDAKLDDNRIKPDQYHFFPMKVKLDELRYYQKEAVSVIEQNLATSIEMCTGSGKTLVIMETIRRRGVNTLIVVPTLNLLNQFYEIATYHFGDKNVGTHKDEELKPIVIANVQGIQKKDETWFKHFDQVVVDEYHHQSSSSYYDLNKNFWENITYRLSVSATPFRNDGADMKLEAISGAVKYSYPAWKAINDGFIVPPHFLIYKFEHMTAPSSGWHADYERYIVNHKGRNNKLIEIVKQLLEKTNKNILVLANRIEHVNKLSEALPDSVIVTGQTKNNKKAFEAYRMGKIRCIAATSQVLSEGVDLPQVDIVILAGGYESEILISQTIGRAVRLDPERGKKFALVIDIYDVGPKILERHSKERLRIYKNNYGAQYIKLKS